MPQGGSHHVIRQSGAWVGRCVSHRAVSTGERDDTDREPPREFECHAAVWTDSRDGFIATVRRRLADTGHTLIDTEGVRPIIEWLKIHGYRHSVEALAIQVNASRAHALGPIVPVASRPEPDTTLLRAEDAHPWVGRCFFRQWSSPAPDAAESTPREHAFKDYTCLAVAWTDHLDGFTTLVKRHLDAQGHTLTWAEDIHPAHLWLDRHGYDAEVVDIAPRIGADRRVETGAPTRLGEDGQPLRETWLVIDEIANVAPLDMQFGVHPPKSVPDALYEPLFGQPFPAEEDMAAAEQDASDHVPPMRTFAILDAARVLFLRPSLESSELDFRCLFKGEAERTLEDVAPYIVELQENDDFTRKLFTLSNFTGDLWEKEPGIYLRSRGTLDDMFQHFRRFTRVQDEHGTWFYLRFWEPATLIPLLDSMPRQQAITFFGDVHCMLSIRPGKCERVMLRLEMP